MNFKNFKTSRAFTLVELIIGVTILSIASTAVFSLILVTINLNTQNLYKVQALEFAREGLEAVRNIRDTNWKNNQIFSCLKAVGNVCQIPNNLVPNQAWPAKLNIILSADMEPGAPEPWMIDLISIGNPEKPTITELPTAELLAIKETDPTLSPPRDITRNIITKAHATGMSGKKIGAGFYRYVTIEATNSISQPRLEPTLLASTIDPAAIKVTVTVAYLQNGKLKTTQISEILTDWRKI